MQLAAAITVGAAIQQADAKHLGIRAEAGELFEKLQGSGVEYIGVHAADVRKQLVHVIEVVGFR